MNPKLTRIAQIAGFAVFTAVYFLSYFHRVAIPGTIFNELQADFDATAMQISALGGGFLCVYAFMQLFAGILVDRWGALKIILFGGLAMTVGTFGFAAAQSYLVLLGYRLVIALGASLIFIALVREIANIFSEKNFTVFLSATLIIGYAGGLSATYPFVRAVNVWGWRGVLFSLAIVCLAILALLLLMLWRGVNTGVEPVSISLRDLSRIGSNIMTFPIYAANCIAFGICFLMQSAIGKKMLEDCFGYSPDLAASYTFAMLLAVMTGTGLSGFLSRLLNNRRKPLIVASSLLVLSFSLLTILAIKGVVGQFVILPAYLMLGLSTVGLPVGISSTRELNFPKFTGTAVGFLNAGSYATVAILVIAAGSVLDLFDEYALHTETGITYPANAYVAVLLMCLVVAVFSVFGSFIVRETKGINISA